MANIKKNIIEITHKIKLYTSKEEVINAFAKIFALTVICTWLCFFATKFNCESYFPDIERQIVYLTNCEAGNLISCKKAYSFDVKESNIKFSKMIAIVSAFILLMKCVRNYFYEFAELQSDKNS